MDIITRIIFDIVRYVSFRILSKTYFLAFYVKLLCLRYRIKVSDYAIIAGYCLHKYGRIVTDIDVIVNDSAFEKLHIANVGKFSINGVEKILITIPNTNLEIEIYKRETTGFPSNYFSVTNLHKNNLVDYDKFNNPYLNEKTLIHFYSEVKKTDNRFCVGDQFFSKEKIQKNIGHLRLVQTHTTSNKEIVYDKILYLTKLIQSE